MISKQFFNLYGKEHGQQENGFQKGERVFRIETSEEGVLQPETIQINYSSRAKLKATPRVFMAASPAGNDKELTNLREEVHLLKKRIEDMKRQHDL